MSDLIGRAQRILLSPKTEWPVIAAEADTTAGIYKKYIAILAALGPVAMFLKSSLIGYSVFGLGTYRADIGSGLIHLVVSYGLSLLAVYLFALIINALAPSFGAQKDSLLALKTAAYSMTAAWIAGIGNVLPSIGVLIGLAGAIYSIYLLYLGLPITMKAPPDKAAGYTAVCVIVGILLSWIVFAIAAGVVGRGLWGGYGVGVPSVGETGSFDKDSALGKLEEWSKEVEAAGKRVEESAESEGGAPSGAAIGQLMGAVVGGSGKGVDALPTDEIKRFLPETLGGLPRTNLSATRNTALGIEVSEATADYSDGAGRNLRLELNDTGGAQGLIALANWAGVEQESEWPGGYERDYRADGRMLHERWDGASGTGEFGMIVGERFSVKISGKAASMDELKAALATGVNVAGLETMASQAKSQD